MAKKTRTRRTPAPVGLSVGSTVDAIRAARQAVLDILAATSEPTVAVAALTTFAHICEVKHVSITGNTFTAHAHGS